MLSNNIDNFTSHRCTPEYLDAKEDRESRLNDPVVSKVRSLNDDFRKTFNPALGDIFLTISVSALPAAKIEAVKKCVQKFNDFNVDNDPHAEHDFFSFDYDDTKYFVKIDYYDRSLKWGTENPEDPTKCKRVLTIMFASEY